MKSLYNIFESILNTDDIDSLELIKDKAKLAYVRKNGNNLELKGVNMKGVLDQAGFDTLISMAKNWKNAGVWPKFHFNNVHDLKVVGTANIGIHIFPENNQPVTLNKCKFRWVQVNGSSDVEFNNCDINQGLTLIDLGPGTRLAFNKCKFTGKKRSFELIMRDSQWADEILNLDPKTIDPEKLFGFNNCDGDITITIISESNRGLMLILHNWVPVGYGEDWYKAPLACGNPNWGIDGGETGFTRQGKEYLAKWYTEDELEKLK